MTVALTNLSNNLYKKSRQRLNESALKFGINQLYSYDFEDLKSTEFFKENKELLSFPKGLGYWSWKPYIILETIQKLKDGDIIVYSDCGIEIIAPLDPLINLCKEKEDILIFANSNLINKDWTKRDCFYYMNCDTIEYWDGKHCDASFILFRKSKKSLQFLHEYLLFSKNKNIISDQPNISGLNDLESFKEHRRDQSILSLLAIKYKLELYRMPTQFGNHYKIFELRIEGEFNCINQADYTQLDYYATNPFNNSNYPQLLNHHRDKVKQNLLLRIITKLFDRIFPKKQY